MSWSNLISLLCVAACSSQEVLPWWRTATFYQVFPRSFKDSNGDGTGDLKGITEKVHYFKEIGVDAIWLSPILKSPMVDFGYDISDFRDIDPIFGTMNDFDELLAKLKSIGVKMVMDFVPHHTSDKHEWFQFSSNTSHPLHLKYKDFYVWQNANGTTEKGEPIPPNNWMSMFGGPAWTWNKDRQQFYQHQFTIQQPDLNFRNPMVVSNVTDILNFWLDKGVDGFRIDAANFLLEDANITNEKPYPGTPGDTWFNFNHTSTINQPGSFQLLSDWAELLYQRSLKSGKELAMFLEAYATLDITIKYYGSGNSSLKIPFNFFLMDIANPYTGADDFKRSIDMWMTSMPKDGVANWVVGNHDVKRFTSTFGTEMVDAINLVTGVLPGVKVVYYGEEIGMETTDISWNQTVDPLARSFGPSRYQEISRDVARTPMQWDDSPNAGFSNSSFTWLPLNPNFWYVNVASQKTASVSHLKVFQALTKARKDPVLQRGDLQVLVPDNKNNTLVIVRSYNGSNFVLITNLDSYSATYTSQNFFIPKGLDQDMTVVVGSINSGYMSGVTLLKGSQNITLRPKAAILLRSGIFHSSTSEAFKQMYSIFPVIVAIIFMNCYIL